MSGMKLRSRQVGPEPSWLVWALLLLAAGPAGAEPVSAKSSEEETVQLPEGQRIRLTALYAPEMETGGSRAFAAGQPFPVSDEMAQSRERLDLAFRIMQLTTAGVLVVNNSLGIIAAINRPTVFGDGECADGDPVLDEYGCNTGLSTLHGIFGALTLATFTSTEALDFARGRLPGPARSPAFRISRSVVRYLTIATMLTAPLLGLMGAYPAVAGVDVEDQAEFSRQMRTAHVFIGITATLAQTTAILMDQVLAR